MLQQTRVSTVIPFYNNWLSKWPTVDSLAQASQDEVLSAWKGLGYYSRATRLHEAAQQIVRDLGKEIPADVEGLLRIKGIGRYTAGAVSSIAFGRAVPLLDGNVSRVLSRQMGLYARVKDKKVEDILWDAAKALVERISGHSGEEEESSIPGRWNQGLMELGSTICIPKNPKCIECPIRSTCRAYSEGMALVESNRPQTQEEQGINDIEDACCTLCLHLASEDLPVRKTKENHKKRPAEALPSSTRASKRAAKQSTLDALFFTRPKQQQQQLVIKAEEKTEKAEEIQIEEIPAYCSLFPARDAKKAVPTQDCLVCIIQRRPRSNSRAARGKKSTTVTTQSESENANANASKGAMYLIEQRPEKGLLANLWQFPNVQLVSSSLPEDKKTRSEQARGFVLDMLAASSASSSTIEEEEEEEEEEEAKDDYTLSEAREVGSGGDGGCITHVFTHLKLRMFVLGFVLECEDGVAEKLISSKRMWVDEQGVEAATLGAGMQRCWKGFLDM